jgi:hypothetical protein
VLSNGELVLERNRVIFVEHRFPGEMDERGD